MPRKKIQIDPRYHDTLLLMTKYRDVVWSLSVAVEQTKSDFRQIFGTNVEEFLDSIYLAGVDLDGTEIQGRARSIERSKKMLDLIDSAVATLRHKNKNGELYYQILYWNYLSPQEPANAEEIVDHLEEENIHMTKRTMTSYRMEAVNCISFILWGYTSRDSCEILGRFVNE
ncbi:MAG: hypothetical protein MJ175_11885 [Clostridia bacterium]|nr:hypothetical protein [Clostridia bacterium]